MEQQDILDLLTKVKEQTISPESALQQLKISPFEELGYAKVDHHRSLRQGTNEVIYGEGKTKEQLLGIATSMVKNGEQNILITRLSESSANFLKEKLSLFYEPISKIGIVNQTISHTGFGKIIVATGGTSDIPVAEEAALTAETLGNQVIRLYDVGVSGIHRLLAHVDLIANATVIIAVAGMEGALASVIGGLSDCPVIAVPTSVGYGANFGGLSALLSMLNSCASGVSVVNIDNGFGAGYLASMINHIPNKVQLQSTSKTIKQPNINTMKNKYAKEIFSSLETNNQSHNEHTFEVTEQNQLEHSFDLNKQSQTEHSFDINAKHNDSILELRCNLDDMTPEQIGYATNLLLQEGALDVYTTSIGMKKDRPATMLTCLCKKEVAEKLKHLLLLHTTTLGIRFSSCDRAILTSKHILVETPYGKIRFKQSIGFGIEKYKPEYEDLKKNANTYKLPISTIKEEAYKQFNKQRSEHICNL